jgi:hypothetical protein
MKTTCDVCGKSVEDVIIVVVNFQLDGIIDPGTDEWDSLLPRARVCRDCKPRILNLMQRLKTEAKQVLFKGRKQDTENDDLRPEYDFKTLKGKEVGKYHARTSTSRPQFFADGETDICLDRGNRAPLVVRVITSGAPYSENGNIVGWIPKIDGVSHLADVIVRELNNIGYVTLLHEILEELVDSLKNDVFTDAEETKKARQRIEDAVIIAKQVLGKCKVTTDIERYYK